MQNDAMDLQEAEISESPAAFKVNIKVLDGFFEMFRPNHFRRSMFLSCVRDFTNIQSMTVAEILAAPSGQIRSKVPDLKYKTPADRFFLMYFVSHANVKCISLHPNKQFKTRIEQLQNKINALQKQKDEARQEALIRIANHSPPPIHSAQTTNLLEEHNKSSQTLGSPEHPK